MDLTKKAHEEVHDIQGHLTGPTAGKKGKGKGGKGERKRGKEEGESGTIILSRCTVALHSVALRFPGYGGVSQENRAAPPQRTLWPPPFQLEGPVAPTFSALKGGVALQGAFPKVSWYRGVSQPQCHCCQSRYNGQLGRATEATNRARSCKNVHAPVAPSDVPGQAQPEEFISFPSYLFSEY